MNCLKVTDPDSGARVRSWSSSQVDSLGGSTHSKQSMDSHDNWRRVRLQQIFYKSVIDNDLEIAVRCLQHGADVSEEYQPLAQTVLHKSAHLGFLRTTELLLRAGANPNTLDEKTFLPLHFACQEGHFHTVRCLLIYGTMVSIENEYGDAPIHTTTRYGHLDIIPLLLSVEIKRDFGLRTMPDHLQGILHLNLQNANGDTPLHIASALDRKAIVKKLLLWGADQSIQNRQGYTPLQVALEKQHPHVVKLLRTPNVVLNSHETFAQTSSSSLRDSGRFTGSESSYPFKNLDGLQKYTDDKRKQKFDVDGIPRSYLDGSIVPKISPSDTPGQINTTTVDGRNQKNASGSQTGEPTLPNGHHFVKRRSSSNRSSPSKKIIEREPLPNNLNDPHLDDISFRVSHFQSYGQRHNMDYHLARSVDDKLHLMDRRDGREMSTKVDRKIDALSLEVNSKLKQIDSRYQEIKARENHLLQPQAPVSTTTFAKSHHRRCSKNDTKRDHGRESSQIKITFGPSNPSENFILTTAGGGGGGGWSQEPPRTIRCSSIPPAPVMPQQHSQQWVKGEHVVVRKIGPEEPQSTNNIQPTLISSPDLDEESQEALLNTRVLGTRNGEKIINPAPKISDIYGVGRVSPKIKELQDQLRRSQLKTANYELYVEDYLTK